MWTYILYLLVGLVALSALMDYFENPSKKLWRAAQEGDLSRVNALLSKKVNLEEAFEGKTPLMVAAYFGRAQAVGALLLAGSDPRREIASKSALSHAAHGYGLCVRIGDGRHEQYVTVAKLLAASGARATEVRSAFCAGLDQDYALELLTKAGIV